MKYFSLREPRGAVQIYAPSTNMRDFVLAQSPETVAGKVIEGEEDHFDDAGNRQKSYGIGMFYDALYVPVDKASIIGNKLTDASVDFYTAEIMTLQGNYTAFRSFNLYDEFDPKPMFRLLHSESPRRLQVDQYFSEEFLDFLGEHFPMENFYRINPPGVIPEQT